MSQIATKGTVRTIIRDAIIIAGASAMVALLVNALRTNSLPLVATQEIETMVPCPEPMGEATPIPATDDRIRSATSLLVDARSAEDFASWHAREAVSFPFDWLAESDEVKRQAAQVAKEIARTRRRYVVVYGDGEDPDSGEHWAALLSGAGIKNVVFVKGGAPALGQPAVSPIGENAASTGESP
jgi:rhodanese-related sulfurtransferase